MNNTTSAINVNVDSNIKKEATRILNDLGMNMSTAINVFLTQVVKRDGIPFEITNPKPTRELIKALKEAEIIKEESTTKGYNDINELKEALLDK